MIQGHFRDHLEMIVTHADVVDTLAEIVLALVIKEDSDVRLAGDPTPDLEADQVCIINRHHYCLCLPLCLLSPLQPRCLL